MAILCLDHPPPQVSWEARSHTEKEQACLPQVLQHFKSLEELSVAEGATEGAPLTEKEKFWLTQDEMYRFIRATKCDAKAAIARLEKTLIWRRTHKSQYDSKKKNKLWGVCLKTDLRPRLNSR